MELHKKSHLTGDAEEIKLTEEHDKVSKLQMPINTDPLALQRPFKPSPILEAPPFTKGIPQQKVKVVHK